ncbi:hypothetical protein [Natronosalvus vescus]|uniref:hypothetical protein n=1 Tax=Natronosalvus vescus TaxID=2953881 RepID=UPI002090D07C|nr:hypothetical protein [Natronosalvus vescus]
MATRFKHPEIRETDNRLELWDPIERSTMGFSLPDSVTLEPANADAFYFPVDTAVRFETSLIECEGLHDIHVWTGDGEFVAESTNGEPLFLPHDTYLFDLTGPIKTYFQVDGPLQVLSDGGRSSIAFGGETTVTLGIRSFHDNPAGEIVVDDDPYTLLEAIPFLATSLKTLSPERSFPSMRGHPPRLVRRDSTPEEPLTADLEKPDTGIHLEVPPTFRHLYPIAPLAFYLGADVLPASQPRLRTQSQRLHLRSIHEEYDTAVSRLLQHVFFLDCLTRTEGYFQVPLHERQQFELALRHSREGPDELDFAELYDLPIAERVDRYLEVPFSVFEHLLPEWRLTADVQPDAEYLECLPFLVADLATIRCPNPTPVSSVPQTPQPVQDFFRDGSLDHNSLEFVETPRSNSLEQTFIGESNPLDASKATLESFESRFQRTATDREDIEVAVVRNDEEMEGERVAVSESYGSLEETGASVRFLENCTVEELHTLFTSETDFVHYIGHVDGRGLECADGYFDATAHEEYGVGAFILNGCQSYRQGEALIRGGCIGGVVTASAVLNEPAVEIGGTFARLLADGFSLRAATTIATDQRIVGNQYLVIGDGEVRIADRENTTPMLGELELRNDNQFDITIKTFPTNCNDMGCLFTPLLNGVDKRYLSSGVIDTITVTKEDLIPFFDLSSFPVQYQGKLVWSKELLEYL